MRAPQTPHIHRLCSESAPSNKMPRSVAAFIAVLKSIPIRGEMVAPAAPDWGETGRAQAPGQRPRACLTVTFLTKL